MGEPIIMFCDRRTDRQRSDHYMMSLLCSRRHKKNVHYKGQYVVTKFDINRGYQTSVGLILSLLNELNKRILCEPLESIILFYSTSSIILVINLHEFNILFITYPQKYNY